MVAMLLPPTNPPGIELYIINGKNDNEKLTKQMESLCSVLL